MEENAFVNLIRMSALFHSMSMSMSKIVFALVSILCLLLVTHVDSMAQFMLRECEKSLEVGTVIMNKAVVAKSDRTVIVKQHGVVLNNATVLSSIEEVEVEISPPTSQVVFELRGDPHRDVIIFHKGSCGGKRVEKKGKLITRDLEGFSGDDSSPITFTLTAAWAATYTSGVVVTLPFQLTWQPSSASDVRAVAEDGL
eukprot:scaffold2913_cov181-Ochromonas_danica.AAC.55